MADKAEIIREYVEGLIADEANAENAHAAQPAYYGIWTCEDIVTSRGYGDDAGKFYTAGDWGQPMTPREAFKDVFDNEEIYADRANDAFAESYENIYDYIEEHDGALPDSIEDDEIIDFLCEEYSHSLDYLPMTRIGKIAPNAMFLTEREARKHLEANGYHYSPDARVTAMTAWRNPSLSEFLRVLRDIDFDKSEIVFKNGTEAPVGESACDRCGKCKCDD